MASQPGQPMGQQGPLPGPPYQAPVALLGGLPTVTLDVPICAVFILLYVGAAAGNMTIFQMNRARGHKFLMSGALFGFCMARISANVMRIVWATRPTSVNIAIAANVLVVAGVIILFVINALFAQRVVRAAHPRAGWHAAFRWFFRGLWILLGVSFCLLISFSVVTFFTLDPTLRTAARDLQLYGQAFFLALALLPVPLVLGALAITRRTRVEKFGSGRWRTKIAVLVFSSLILSLGAAFRLGTSAMSPRPKTDPAWYQSKACFYVFNFAIEIVVVYLYVLIRVDRRFHIPDGAKGPGDYNGTSHPASKTGLRVLSEEEVFDDAPTPPEELQDRRARSMLV